MLLWQILACAIHEKIKKLHKSNKFNITAPTWNEKFDLPDGSYSVSDIEDFFKFIIKMHEKFTDNHPNKIYINRRENRITFKTKTGYYLKLLTPETINYLGAVKKDN